MLGRLGRIARRFSTADGKQTYNKYLCNTAIIFTISMASIPVCFLDGLSFILTILFVCLRQPVFRLMVFIMYKGQGSGYIHM